MFNPTCLKECTITSLNSAPITADGNSAAVDLLGYEGHVAIVLNVGDPTAGSSPTLAVKLQHCDTSGGTYADVSGGGFTSYTTTGSLQTLVVDVSTLKRYIEINFDIGGTMSPSYPVGACLVGQKKYQ